MGTKKSASKTEVAADRSIAAVEKLIADSQVKVREGLNNIGAAMLDKAEELQDLKNEIEDAEAQLAELNEAGEIYTEMSELKIKLEDAKLASKRSIELLKQDYADAKQKLDREKAMEAEKEAREKAEFERAAKIELEDATRARKLAQEDVDRQRDLQWQSRKGELDALQAGLQRQAEEMASFEDRVAVEVGEAKSKMAQSHSFEVRQIKSDADHKVMVLSADNTRLADVISDLQNRLDRAEKESRDANDKANALALATVDAESGKKALDELRTVAHKQADGKK